MVSIRECEVRVPDIPSSTWEITVCCYWFLMTSLKNRVYHSGVIISRSTMTRDVSEGLDSLGSPWMVGVAKMPLGGVFNMICAMKFYLKCVKNWNA